MTETTHQLWHACWWSCQSESSPSCGSNAKQPCEGPGCRETGGKLGQETKTEVCTTAAHFELTAWIKSLHLQISALKLFFLSLSSFNLIIFYFVFYLWLDPRWQLSSTHPLAQPSCPWSLGVSIVPQHMTVLQGTEHV